MGCLADVEDQIELNVISFSFKTYIDIKFGVSTMHQQKKKIIYIYKLGLYVNRLDIKTRSSSQCISITIGYGIIT